MIVLVGYRIELDFIIRVNSHPNRDFPDRYWSEVRSLCQGCYPVLANLFPWNWKHGEVNLMHWSCLEMDYWGAWQNDILSYCKEKEEENCENIIRREWKRLGPGATDSQAMMYGAKQAKYRMLEVLCHSCGPHINEDEKAYIDEYIRFLAVATSHYIIFERFGWKTIQD